MYGVGILLSFQDDGGCMRVMVEFVGDGDDGQSSQNN
jgi:hypothetical protein